MSKNISDLIHPKDSHYLGLWKQDLYSAWFWVEWHDKELAERFQVPLKEGGICIVNGHFAVKHEVIAEVRKCFLEKVEQNDKVFFERITALALKEFEQVEIESRQLIEASRSQTVWNSYLHLGQRLMFSWCLFVLFSYCLDEALMIKVKEEGIGPQDISSLIPPVRTLLTEQREAARALREYLKDHALLPSTKEEVTSSLQAIKDNPEAWSKLQAHLDAFGWIEMANFIGEPMSAEGCLQHLLNLSDDVPVEKKTHKVSPALTFLTESAAQISLIRQLSAEYFAVFSYRTRPFLQKIADDLGLGYRELLRLLPEEMEGGLFQDIDRLSLRRLARQREKSGYIISKINEQTQVWDELEDVQTAESMFVPLVDEKAQVLKGVTAHPGHVTGTAKVILHTDEFHKMADGDVLITTMTTPDFVLLMQRASAIVTDIGGLLSHAAIVSRELKKPCLIGTKFATRIFKDGDTIEVNAAEGWVKKS